MKASILIVDDDFTIADLVYSVLEEAGYGVRHADNADAAFSALKSEPVDLLLLDIEMSGISGLKLLELLKQEPRYAALPVIIITVKGEESSKIKGLQGGADDYLVKPFSEKALLARVEALLRRVRRAGQVSNVLEAGHISVDLDRR